MAHAFVAWDWLLALALGALVAASSGRGSAEESTPEAEALGVLERRCLECHSQEVQKGRLSLATPGTLERGGRRGPAVVPGRPEASLLLEMVSGPDPRMPKGKDPLAAAEIDAIRRWIAAGAPWPGGRVLEPVREERPDAGALWSLEPLRRPPVPRLTEADARWARTPIDAFAIRAMRAQGLRPSPEAGRRALIRRLTFDLTGLAPSYEEVEAFAADPSPHAYEKLADRLLASPAYGERWARHWLDVVHYGDTHGYDKDKVRPNAYPYRDYTVRAFNDDRDYTRFVEEQLAGDVLRPGAPESIAATGFIVAGPFDWVGQIEVAEGTMEKRQVRNLDRDDMVKTAMGTFVSLTAECARCHDHKFDPIPQEDYYRLQAIFAGVDRAERPLDPDPETAARRKTLADRIGEIERRLRALEGPLGPPARPEYGYHSRIEREPGVVKWVQVDLGSPVEIAGIIYVACYDEFGGIGAGFGFPPRFRIVVSNDPEFRDGVAPLAGRTEAVAPNPGLAPQWADGGGHTARFVRFTATELAERTDDFIFALAELIVLTPEGINAAGGREVTALDSIEAPPRWATRNLTDGIFHGAGEPLGPRDAARLRELAAKAEMRAEKHAPALDGVARLREAKAALEAERAALPAPARVFAAATHFKPEGSFLPAKGRPRPIYLLRRGNAGDPDTARGPVGPGALGALEHLRHHFELPEGHGEGERRVALARWITDRENPLTWRSIANRIWYYHFGRGIVETLDDFGRMGAQPVEPDLLDWLAVELRDGGQSLKMLHRLIVTSSVYRQSSRGDPANERIDGDNRFLWRMNRRKLEAEAIRDTVLAAAGKLDRRMYGPGFRAFGFQDDHSPHYKYHEHDPGDPATWRRSVYRFLVRSVPDPFMQVLDCADPSQVVSRRIETITALQALALLNNKFMVRMSEYLAERVERAAGGEGGAPERVRAAYRFALAREPSANEVAALVPLVEETGLANVCRVLINTNEFVFAD